MPKPAPVTDERLNALPVEALECRERSHMWPRSRNRGEMKLIPTQRRGGQVTEYLREMVCLGGCGRIRVETIHIDSVSGSAWRVGGLRYRQQEGTAYLLAKPDDGKEHQPVTRDEVRYALLRRGVHPGLGW